MLKRLLLGCFILVTLSNSLSAQISSQIPSEKPKLIIGIIIDQMRYDYLFKYWDKYDNNGFKRLVNEGSVCKDARFNYMITQSAPGFATISTGANPSAHGIIADSWYTFLSDKITYCTKDDDVTVTGNESSNEKHSPKMLIASTFGDELKMATYKKAKVYSVSFEPVSAILCAGHLADAAWWFDASSGTFVTSSFYQKTIPDWINDFNKKKLPDTYLDRSWETLLPIEQYKESLPDNNNYETGIHGQKTFPYDLKTLSKNNGTRDYSILKYTPFSNNLVKDFAISLMVNEILGKDDVTDYLCINLSSTEYISQLYSLSSVEMEDACLRLDKDIQHFLDFIDSYSGKGNTLIYLTSNHGASYQNKWLKDIGFPADEFNQEQALYLLKSYLNIVYGKGDWIKYYNNQQIFLNRNLIQDSKLSLEKFQDDVAQFMVQFSGVTHVATASMLQKTNFADGIFDKMQNSYHQKRSGDIMINLEPGWAEKSNLATTHNSAYNYDTHVPLIFYGWRISRQTVYSPVNMTDIAPTLSSFLDIPFPNAAQGHPIGGLLK